MTVFISYRHVDPDQGLADELYRSLVARGQEVFIDKRISIGTEWARKIQEAIGKARFFVVLLSAESIRSDMLRKEVALAHERQHDGALTILPVNRMMELFAESVLARIDRRVVVFVDEIDTTIGLPFSASISSVSIPC